MFTDTTLATAEPLKSFTDTDSLGKAYLELHGRVSSGDISVLPEEVRKDPTIANYKNLSEVAKGLIETKKLVGQIKKPPETADGYKLTPLQNLHKGLSNVEGTQKALAQLSHKYGLHQDQADGLQKDILTLLSGSLSKNDEIRAENSKKVETELRGKWGSDYEKNYNNVKNVLERIGLNDLVGDLSGNATRLAGFHKLTALLSEDSIANLGGESQGGGDPKTNAEGLESLKKFNEEVSAEGRKHPFLDDKNPKHKESIKKYNDLMKVAYGVK